MPHLLSFCNSDTGLQTLDLRLNCRGSQSLDVNLPEANLQIAYILKKIGEHSAAKPQPKSIHRRERRDRKDIKILKKQLGHR